MPGEAFSSLIAFTAGEGFFSAALDEEADEAAEDSRTRSAAGAFTVWTLLWIAPVWVPSCHSRSFLHRTQVHLFWHAGQFQQETEEGVCAESLKS